MHITKEASHYVTATLIVSRPKRVSDIEIGWHQIEQKPNLYYCVYNELILKPPIIASRCPDHFLSSN